MPWFAFESVETRAPAPVLELESPYGYRVSLAQYRSRYNLVLYFPQSVAEGVAALSSFAERTDDYWEKNARAVIVLPAPAGMLVPARRLPPTVIPLLDPGRQGSRLYERLLPGEGRGEALLFVLDRYAVPFAALIGENPVDMHVQDQILEWLDFIELQCPE